MDTKKCAYCKSDIDKTATVCPHCQKNQPVKGHGCLLAVGVLVLIGLLGSCMRYVSDETENDSTPTPVQQTSSVAEQEQITTTANSGADNASTEASTAPSVIHYEADFSSGYYTSGIDFPAGKYDITAIDGDGNVSSDNMFNGGINAMMGVDGSSELYELSYQNVSLPKGVVLHVSGLTINISSDNASADPLTPREQPNTETFTFSSGYFTAGEDFPAGTYDVTAIEGSGNISSDNIFDGGINEMIAADSPSDMYINSFKNLYLEDGNTLNISGVTVELSPSK